MARYILAVLMAFTITLPGLAQVHPDAGSWYEIEGIVNSVQWNYFTVMAGANAQTTVNRVMLRSGTNMPQEIITGCKIRLIAFKDSQGQYVLDEIEAITRGTVLPAPTPALVPTVPIPIPGVPVPVPVPIP